jgi:hypothetical protein
MADAAQGMATIFDKGNWYHELLEDGLAISYRVRRLPIALFSSSRWRRRGRSYSLSPSLASSFLASS